MYPRTPEPPPPKRKNKHLRNILWGSHRGNTAASEVTAACQKLPKGIYLKVNMYAKNTMETAVGENQFLKMLNDPPLQRH